MKYKVDFEIELNKNPYTGLYIALEGIDGAGKTTQAEDMAKYFREQGREVVVTAEPTRTGEIGSLVNRILKGEVKIPSKYNQYIFSADRGIHQEDLVIPSLKAGKVVISDRCFWSTLAYGILDKEMVEGKRDENFDQMLVAYSILSFYHQFVVPDVTVLLDIDSDIAVDRLSKKGEGEIYENKEMVEKVKAIYDLIVTKFPSEFTVVEGGKDEAEVTRDIAEKVKLLNK
ncbi:MAG TPA: dTMP kinase [Patescibacteria group bacterium]|nr:dTMP kinase [Patescibacteria group bacterium]